MYLYQHRLTVPVSVDSASISEQCRCQWSREAQVHNSTWHAHIGTKCLMGMPGGHAWLQR